MMQSDAGGSAKGSCIPMVWQFQERASYTLVAAGGIGDRDPLVASFDRSGLTFRFATR